MSQTLFDLSEHYEAMLDQGISLSGEDRHFFIEGRIRNLKGELPFSPKEILDFGCGIGDTSERLANSFADCRVLGVDTSEPSLKRAQACYESDRVGFEQVSTLDQVGRFDLCYVNGVFHHIVPKERDAALRKLFDALRVGGFLALFENNPWNLGTRLVMKRIPFDRDAILISPLEARTLLRRAGFKIQATRYLFFFPHFLRLLRCTEGQLSRVPLGAQYCVLAVKPPHGAV